MREQEYVPAHRHADHRRMPAKMPAPRDRMPARKRLAIYLLLGGLWLSGCAWLVLDCYLCFAPFNFSLPQCCHSLRKSNPTIYKDVVLAANICRILHEVGSIINAEIEEMVVLREQKDRSVTKIKEKPQVTFHSPLASQFAVKKCKSFFRLFLILYKLLLKHS